MARYFTAIFCLWVSLRPPLCCKSLRWLPAGMLQCQQLWSGSAGMDGVHADEHIHAVVSAQRKVGACRIVSRGAARSVFQPFFSFCRINQMSSLAGIDGRTCFRTGTSSALCKLKGTAGRLDTRHCVPPYPELKWRCSNQFWLSSKGNCGFQNDANGLCLM